MYPDDAIQSLVQPWWVAEKSDVLARGRLVYAYPLHADASPFALTAEGRKEPADPARVRLRIEPLHPAAPPDAPSPPAAALPLEPGEMWRVHRARRRACLVVAAAGPVVHRPLRTVPTTISVGPALLVAPYYSAAALDPGFVARVRRAEYPHYVWDRLQVTGGVDVVLRLDQLQPLGRDPAGFEWTDHALAPGAMAMIDEWLRWATTGVLPPGDLRAFRDLVLASSTG